MIGQILTFLMAYGGAAVALVKPFYGLLVYVAFAIVRPEFLFGGSVAPSNNSRVIGIAMLIGWAINGFGKWRFGRAKPIVVAVLGYWAWIIVCACFAADQSVAWNYVEGRSKVLLPLLVGITLIDSAERITQLAWVIVLSQGVVAIFANLDAYLYHSAWLRQQGAGMGDNNFAAASTVAVVGLAVFLGLHQRVLWRKGLLFALAALMVNAVFFSNSRGGMVGLLASGVVGFVLMPKQPKYYLYYAIAAAIVLRLAGPPVIDRFASIWDPSRDPEHGRSAESREHAWRGAWAAMQANPVVGIGPGHWHFLKDNWGVKSAVHSTWMSTGAELGFPGLGLLVMLYGVTLWPLWRLLRSTRGEELWFSNWGRGVITSLSGFIVSGSFITGEFIEQPYYVILLGAGVLMLLPLDKLAPEPAIPADEESLVT